MILIILSQALAAEPFRIGVIFSQTGIAAIHNAPLIEMVQLAVTEINQNKQKAQRPIKLILLDNQSTAIGSRIAAQKAVRLGLEAVIGAHWSSHSIAMAPVLQKNNIPMITPGSTNPKVTAIGDYIFRICFLDSFQGKAMAKFAFHDLNAGTAVILRNIDEEYSIQLAHYFAAAFEQTGGRILLNENYRGKAVDFSNSIEKIKTLSPDVLYIPGYTRDSGLFIKQARTMGLETIFLGGDAWDEIFEYAGPAANGSYHSAPWHPDLPFKKSRHLKALYRQKQNRPIKNMSAPLAYDAVGLLAQAANRVETLDKTDLKTAIAAIHDYKGATGIISFDALGNPKNKGVIIIRLEDKKALYVKTIKH